MYKISMKKYINVHIILYAYLVFLILNWQEEGYNRFINLLTESKGNILLR